jgi:putative hydrolase of the HAD superfamily
MTKLFVFDLGKVILPFEHHQIAAKLHERSGLACNTTPEDLFHFVFARSEGLVNAYEKGNMSSAEFFDEIRRAFRLDVTYEEFKDIWNDIFWENPEVNRAIIHLKERGYPLFLLSNVSELHFLHIIDRYPIIHTFDEWILSFEVGAKKPEKRIYDVIFERMDVAPADVFYIDDIPDFVEAAAGYGIPGMVFTGPEALWAALGEKGI